METDRHVELCVEQIGSLSVMHLCMGIVDHLHSSSYDRSMSSAVSNALGAQSRSGFMHGSFSLYGSYVMVLRLQFLNSC